MAPLRVLLKTAAFSVIVPDTVAGLVPKLLGWDFTTGSSSTRSPTWRQNTAKSTSGTGSGFRGGSLEDVVGESAGP